MARSRTQKQVAKRIDFFYHRETSPMRWFRRALIVGCTTIALCWICASAVLSSGNKARMLDVFTLASIHNPGHVAAPHAMFENDCAKCHEGTGTSFVKTVTDKACLHCHDGAMHRDNQKRANDESGVSREAFTLAIVDDKHPFKAKSAGCIQCHTEHRGEAALLGMDDRNCIVCHRTLLSAADVPAAVPQSAISVTSFEPRKTPLEAGKHPGFGRQISVDGKWLDKTKLKFDHKFHFPKFEGVAAEQTCVFCHTSGTESRVMLDEEAAKKLPPFKSNKNAEPMRNGDSGYMMPVSYQQHCSVCHPLQVTDEELIVSHIDMPGTVTQLKSLSEKYLSQLALMSDDDRKKALTEAPAEDSGGRRRGSKPAEPAEAKAISANKWLKTQLKWVKATAEAVDASKLADEVKAPIAEMAAADAPPNESLMSAYLAFGMSNACAKCHDVAAKSEGEGEGKVLKITTEPTGIPATSRHWFANSRFDHRPHRGMTCVDCHKAALESGDADPLANETPAVKTSTANILSPDIDKGRQGKNCVDCHRPGGSSAEAATGSCVSCHVFHDRSRERPAGAMMLEASKSTEGAKSETTSPGS